MNVQKQMKIHNGEAIFIAPEHSLWDISQAANQAALAGDAPQAFIVMEEELYYPKFVDQILSTRSQLDEAALAFGDSIVGDIDGRLRCAALWDMGNWDGVLLHRKGNTILCAYIPVITKEAALSKRALSMKLAALAEEMKETQVYLDRNIPRGRWKLFELLHYLSEQMEV